MNIKELDAPVSTTTIDKNLVDAPTDNIYEAISIIAKRATQINTCLLYTSPSPRDGLLSRMPSSA